MSIKIRFLENTDKPVLLSATYPKDDYNVQTIYNNRSWLKKREENSNTNLSRSQPMQGILIQFLI